MAALQSSPPALADTWQLPGGKVQPGEPEAVALQRECAEELGVAVSVGGRVGGDLPTSGVEGVLRVYACTLTAGEPAAREHRELRWVGASDLDGLRWLATDRPLVPALRELLGGPEATTPGVL